MPTVASPKSPPTIATPRSTAPSSTSPASDRTAFWRFSTRVRALRAGQIDPDPFREPVGVGEELRQIVCELHDAPDHGRDDQDDEQHTDRRGPEEDDTGRDAPPPSMRRGPVDGGLERQGQEERDQDPRSELTDPRQDVERSEHRQHRGHDGNGSDGEPGAQQIPLLR